VRFIRSRDSGDYLVACQTLGKLVSLSYGEVVNTVLQNRGAISIRNAKEVSTYVLSSRVVA
jgi:hypothetical protein